MIHLKDFNPCLKFIESIGPGIVSGTQNNQLLYPIGNTRLQIIIDISGSSHHTIGSVGYNPVSIPQSDSNKESAPRYNTEFKADEISCELVMTHSLITWSQPFGRSKGRIGFCSNTWFTFPHRNFIF